MNSSLQSMIFSNRFAFSISCSSLLVLLLEIDTAFELGALWHASHIHARHLALVDPDRGKDSVIRVMNWRLVPTFQHRGALLQFELFLRMNLLRQSQCWQLVYGVPLVSSEILFHLSLVDVSVGTVVVGRF